jgi:arginine decarboxylase
MVATPLLDALVAYEALGRHRFTVPGHAGKALASMGFTGLPAQAYTYDQTEVEGLDVLSEPSECIAEAQTVMAQAVGASHSFFMVNGSSGGLTAGMLALLQPNDAVLVPRNAHRAIISGLVLTGAKPLWFMPPWLPEWGIFGPVRAQQVAKLLAQYPQAKGLMITSPTYDGLGSPIVPIANLCQRANVRLLVDEAHGSLWPYSQRLPASAVTAKGVDLVVQSSHKNVGSLTQSAVAHLPHGSNLSPQAFQQALNMVQTTSPSYLLLASLDASRAFWQTEEGQHQLNQHLDHVLTLRQQLTTQLQGFDLFTPPHQDHWDFTRLLIRCRHGESGLQWAPRIEAEQRIPYEHCTDASALYVAGVGLAQDSHQAFVQAFLTDDHTRSLKKIPLNTRYITALPPLPQQVLSPRDAYFLPNQTIASASSIGRIAQQTIVHCPPGIPILLPGEQIESDHLPYLPQTIAVCS